VVVLDETPVQLAKGVADVDAPLATTPAHANTPQESDAHAGEEHAEQESDNQGLDEFEPMDDANIRPSNTVYPYPEILSIPVKEHMLLPSIKAVPVNGFVNLGFNCYFNVVLQLMMHTPGIREYFLSNMHVKEHVEELSAAYPEGFVGRLGELFQLYHSYNDCALSPHKLFEAVAAESEKRFDPLTKEDDAVTTVLYVLLHVHEGLRKIYMAKGDGVIEDPSDIHTVGFSQSEQVKSLTERHDLRSTVSGVLEPNFDAKKFVKLEVKGPKKNPVGKTEKTALEMASLKNFKECLSKGSSVVCDSNLGQLLHKIYCGECGYYLVQFKPFFCLEVPLPDGHEATNLHQIFHHMSTPKAVIGRTIDCPICKGFRKMLASTEIYKLPPVLYVSFQRFVDRMPKNPTLIEIDLAGEDFSEFEVGGFGTQAQPSKKVYKPFFFIVILM
jgi:Ubiquitin carboxyl-terminal hydrolase